MPNTQPNINPTVNFATKSVVKLIRNAFLAMTALNGIFFTLFGAFFLVTTFGTLSYSGETQGRVTGISQSVSDGTTYCTFTYNFSVNDNNYTGASSVGTPTSCAYSTGSSVAIKYDPAKPTSNTSNDAIPAYAGIVFIVIGLVSLLIVVVGILVSIYLSKREDRNNDGLPNDAMPATTAQLNLIQSGMRDLGEFWMPPRKMTQQDAREAISSIQLKLAEQGKTLKP